MKYCIDCNKEITSKATRCNKCAAKYKVVKSGLAMQIRYSSFCVDCGRKINTLYQRCRSCALKKYQESIGYNVKEITYCLDCGKIIDWRSTRCKSCAIKENWKNEEYRLKMSNSAKKSWEHPSEERIEIGKKGLVKARKIAWLLPRSSKQIQNYEKWYKNGAKASQKANPSKPELEFKEILKDKNIDFIHQYSIKNWIVDFLILPKIVIQIDGVYWHCRIKGKMLNDWLQNKKLKEMEYMVIRFWDYEISNDIENCIMRLKRILKNDIK